MARSEGGAGINNKQTKTMFISLSVLQHWLLNKSVFVLFFIKILFWKEVKTDPTLQIKVHSP